MVGPYLYTRMEFDKEEEANRTEEVRKRELERQEYEKAKREEQQLTELQARKLKREATRKKQEELEKELQRLRELREEIAEKRKEALRKIEQRTERDVLDLEHIDFTRLARKLEAEVESVTDLAARRHLVAGAYGSGSNGVIGKLDDLRLYGQLLDDAEMNAPPSEGLLRRWRFEGDLRDEVSGKEIGILRYGGKLVEGGAEGDQAFHGNAKNGRAVLGDQGFGDQFTIVVWVHTTANLKTQVLATNSHATTYQSGFRLLIDECESEDAESGTLKLVTSGLGSGSRTKTIASTENALPFGEWALVAMRIDKATLSADLFVNGAKVTAAGGEVAKDVFTAVTQIDVSLAQQAREFREAIEAQPITPAQVPEFKKQLEKLEEEVASKSENNPSDIQNAIQETINVAQALAEELDGLEAKTDLTAMNDTSAATADFDPPASSEIATPAEMYEQAQELENQIAEANADIQAAQDAAQKNLSYQEARQPITPMTPPRPDLAEALSRNPLKTVGELNELRNSLQEAENEMKDMTARAEAALGKTPNEAGEESSPQTRPAAAFASTAARVNAAIASGKAGSVVNMVGTAGGDGISEGMRADESGEGAGMELGATSPAPRFDRSEILKKALPGRRFTADSLRRGWLYVDTWYVIGPWENHSRIDYTNTHPPEYDIDFDARYRDGKFADEPDHPSQILKWEFYQSDQVRSQPPRVYGASTYYAYTDLWFEHPRTMLIAVASDDAARMWLNGELVWQDEGLSPWTLGEGYRRVYFRQGFNDLLVRIENGPAHCVWSVLLCPAEVE
tara:strand:- start:695 stop:3079 length:2385 start_codon:yes stop_codon:yes gene_type:complete